MLKSRRVSRIRDHLSRSSSKGAQGHDGVSVAPRQVARGLRGSRTSWVVREQVAQVVLGRKGRKGVRAAVGRGRVVFRSRQVGRVERTRSRSSRQVLQRGTPRRLA